MLTKTKEQPQVDSPTKSMTMIQALRSALDVMMDRDSNVVVFGQDVGYFGGVFRVTEGLQAEFGEERVVDTPLAENGIVGGAIGMAMYGLRPVAEIQFVDFIYPAFDQIVSEMAKLRWRSAGQYACPMVVRAPYGGGIKGGLYHSQSPEAYFCHTAGLTVVIPSTPSDAKGLLLAALAGDDPVIFLEPKRLYRSTREEVAEGAYTVPIGRARVAREGEHCTVLAYGAMIPVAQAIYRENFFPEVKTDWRSHPDFVGHKNWNGCFRCHDGKHVTADGKGSIKASDCRSCHLILAQGNGEQLQQVNAQGHNFFHIDSEYSDFSCTDCHTGGIQK